MVMGWSTAASATADDVAIVIANTADVSDTAWMRL